MTHDASTIIVGGDQAITNWPPSPTGSDAQ
jgi:hypothetical protein